MRTLPPRVGRPCLARKVLMAQPGHSLVSRPRPWHPGAPAAPLNRQLLLCNRLRAPGHRQPGAHQSGLGRALPTAFLLHSPPPSRVPAGRPLRALQGSSPEVAAGGSLGQTVTRRMAWGAHKQHGLVCSSRASGAQGLKPGTQTLRLPRERGVTV